MPVLPPRERPDPVSHRRTQSDFLTLCEPFRLQPLPFAQPRAVKSQQGTPAKAADEEPALAFDYMFRGSPRNPPPAPRPTSLELSPNTPPFATGSDSSQFESDSEDDTEPLRTPLSGIPPRIKRKLSVAFPEERCSKHRANPQHPRAGWF